MQDFVTLVYVGQQDEVEVDGLAELVVRGEPVEVHEQLAGRAPHGHRADEDFDPGEGLLAQPDNWQLYTEPEPPETAKQRKAREAQEKAEAAAAASLEQEQAAAEADAATASDGSDDTTEGQGQ